MQWKENVIREEFSNDEADGILKIPLMKLDIEDKLVWNGNNNGIYSVGSGYRSLIQEENELGPHKFIWKSNWKANVSNKIRVFAWRSCNNILPSSCVLNTRFQGYVMERSQVELIGLNWHRGNLKKGLRSVLISLVVTMDF
ncbi:hypothetical protein Golob_015156 [Gossypium lobatum]|uniref:Reverse transcriptase zinc-binding domain-containing protein n=1 Tax=Gossypium lobatum TaxID=34289 RepID=A0A7J8M092_9ROSI|nr:hypothetical protein [Gossypium lobatum]